MHNLPIKKIFNESLGGGSYIITELLTMCCERCTLKLDGYGLPSWGQGHVRIFYILKSCSLLQVDLFVWNYEFLFEPFVHKFSIFIFSCLNKRLVLQMLCDQQLGLLYSQLFCHHGPLHLPLEESVSLGQFGINLYYTSLLIN